MDARPADAFGLHHRIWAIKALVYLSLEFGCANPHGGECADGLALWFVAGGVWNGDVVVLNGGTSAQSKTQSLTEDVDAPE